MKEKTADEIFKQLYFEKYEDKYNIKYFKGNREIWFYKETREVESNKLINMQQLRAINKKVEELGWIERKKKIKKQRYKY